MNKTAFGYCRVSTHEQADSGLGLEAQEKAIRLWCSANGYALGGIFTDAGLSGKRSDNRPQLHNAISATLAAQGALVVYSLSRLARSTRDAIDIGMTFDNANADLVSTSEKIDTTSPTGRMVFRMLASLAEFERDIISERTKAALAAKRARGEKTGGFTPYGFRKTRDGRLLPVEKEQAAIARMKELRAEGATFQAICDKLDEAGIKSKRGGRWTVKVVFTILAREAK